jgi:hypothetical protein
VSGDLHSPAALPPVKQTSVVLYGEICERGPNLRSNANFVWWHLGKPRETSFRVPGSRFELGTSEIWEKRDNHSNETFHLCVHRQTLVHARFSYTCAPIAHTPMPTPGPGTRYRLSWTAFGPHPSHQGCAPLTSPTTRPSKAAQSRSVSETAYPYYPAIRVEGLNQCH